MEMSNVLVMVLILIIIGAAIEHEILYSIRWFLKSIFAGIRSLKHTAVLVGFALIVAAAVWLYLNRAHILTPLHRPTDGDITATLYVPPLDAFMGRFPVQARYAVFYVGMMSPVMFLATVGTVKRKEPTYEKQL